MKKQKDPYKEAVRYLANAEGYLEKTKVGEDGFYVDEKYVRTAGHTALCGVYVALDPFLPKTRGNKRRQASMYRDIFPKKKYGKERKIFNLLYEYFHYNMGYDGSAVELAKERAMQDAKSLIEWAKANYPKQNVQGAHSTKKPCKTCGRSFLPERKNIVNCKKCRK